MLNNYTIMPFQTYNQFDKRFKNLGKFDSDRTACPLFSLITAYRFMNDEPTSKDIHEKNINSSILNYVSQDIPKYMSFEELLNFTDGTFSEKDIIATSPDLIKENILGYNNIFNLNERPERFCVVFLKNRNFIVVMAQITKDENGEKQNCKYSVRDCHENDQYDFNYFEELRLHLDKTYQFEKLTVVDGIMIEEFSNIEFLVIDKTFNLNNVNLELNMDSMIDTLEDNENEDEKFFFDDTESKDTENDDNPEPKDQNELDEMIAYQMQFNEGD